VARQESTFRPALVSSAGAVGVMQIMPGTAKHLAQTDLEIRPEHIANLESPESSLRLGAHYLARMLERSGGNLVYALASYNAGPVNCDKWRAEFRKADLETFIESIPYSETCDYVKRVLGNYAAYCSLYPPVEPAKNPGAN
jgi:soluble lytic murein transglycosylase